MKSVDSARVYEVGANWQRRWIQTAEEAANLFGADWEKEIQDVSGAYMFLYEVVDSLS